MNNTTIKENTKLPLLSKDQTNQFIGKLKEACQKLSAESIIIIFEEFPLHNFEEKESFLEDANEILAFGANHQEGIEVKSVTPFESRCSACSLGKSVSAYKVIYLKHNDKILPGKFIYERSFAVNFTLKNGELMDVSWCNFFLNEKEIKEIRL